MLYVFIAVQFCWRPLSDLVRHGLWLLPQAPYPPLEVPPHILPFLPDPCRCLPPKHRTCHCLVLQCQCSSLQSSPGRYCPSYLRHFWGGYQVLKLVKQPRIGMTCHVNILQKQTSVLSSSMKILNMPRKMWQKLNWKGSVCYAAGLLCWHVLMLTSSQS